jgi:hypothetical protein
MDPASAGVAFVGFGASLVTLVAVVAQSSKTVHDICKMIKNTPDEIRELQEQLKGLHGLLVVLKGNEQNLGSSMKELWQHSLDQLRADINSFSQKVQRLANKLENSKSSQIYLRAAFRKFYDTEMLAQYREKFTRHIGSLNLLTTEMTRSVSYAPITLQQHWFLIRRLNTAIVPHLLEVNAIDNARSHETTHRGLHQLELANRDVYRQVLKLGDQFDIFLLQSKNDSAQLDRNSRHTTGKTVLVKAVYRTYHLPFGTVQIQLTQRNADMQQSNRTISASSHEISWQFFAPSWITSFGFNARITVDFSQGACSGFQTTLVPFMVNTNPEFENAIRSADILALSRLFDGGGGRPTDYIFMQTGDDYNKRLCSVLEVWLNNPIPEFELMAGSTVLTYGKIPFLFKHEARLKTMQSWSHVYWSLELL